MLYTKFDKFEGTDVSNDFADNLGGELKNLSIPAPPHLTSGESVMRRHIGQRTIYGTESGTPRKDAEYSRDPSYNTEVGTTGATYAPPSMRVLRQNADQPDRDASHNLNGERTDGEDDSRSRYR